MTIDIELKEEYIGQGGVYPTSKKEEITSSIENEPDENITSTKTPIISDKYIVKYEINAPTGCEVSEVPKDESYFVFDTVAKTNVNPTCNTYQFKGWEIVTKDVTKVNDDYFIMPEEDVIIRATWSKLAINKSMNGEVSKVQTLYNVMADDAVPDNIKSEFVTSETGIDFGGISSDTNGKGVYQLASTKNDEFPVYYYRGDVKNNNVKFANICWKMVRTTSTGGVKLIYNGVPDEEGKCINTTGTSTQIGTSGFNSSMYGSEHSGYMYGTVYKETYKTLPKWYELINKKAENSNLYKQNIILAGTKEYYSDSVIWDGTNYVLTNKDGSEVVQIEWNNESYSTFKGKYRCLDGNQTTCTEVYYVAGTGTKYSYTLSLTNGQLLKDVNTELNLGKGVIYADGKYTLEEITTINKVDWFDNYKTYNNYYMCQDGSISCTEVTYIVGGRSEYITNVVINNGETYESLNEQAKNIKWLYGNDVSWDGNNYTLINTTESSPVEWESERNKIGNGYHYTCFSTENSCSSINYIYYSITPTYYVILNNGTTIDKALEEMQVNETNSLIKTEVDKWYRDNMTEYTTYLEDTVWCNDRSMGNSNGWTKDGDASNFLEYGPSSRARKPDISCKNKNDSFTVSEENGNGALIYPVALLTSDEIALAGGKPTSNNREYYLYTNQSWWSMSPSKFVSTHLFGTHINEFGNIVANYINSNVGIRPAISIKVDTKIFGGNGTANDPYTLELG